MRASERGRTRTVPLHREAHHALTRWYASRPASASDALFVSLHQRRSAQVEAISASAVGDVVAKQAARAGVRDDHRYLLSKIIEHPGPQASGLRDIAGEARDHLRTFLHAAYGS